MASRKRKKKSSKLVELSSLVLLSFSIILMLGVVTGDQYLGALGQRITEGLVQLVGYPFIIVPLLMGAWGVAFLLRKDKRKLAVATAYGLGGMVFFALTISFIALEWAWAEETGFAWGGIFGRYLAERCQENLGVGGTIIGLLTIVAMLVIHITDLRLVQLLQFLERVATLLKRGLVGVAGLVKNGLTWCGGRLAQSFAKIREQLQKSGSKPKKTKTTEPADIEEDIPQIREEASDPIDREWLEDAGEEEQTDFEFIDHALAAEEYQDEATEPGEDEEPAEYQFPPIELLNPPPAETVKVSKEDCMALASVIEEKLGDFGVKARVVKVTPGPVITLYEVNPAPGVKISRIENLRDDLALALKADGLRIIAPIPGKDVVGIEVPNQVRETVYLRSVLHSEAFREADSKLTIVLGKTIDGQVYTADIAKMPHLLIAGATGQGKSVCINMILACILYRALPEEVQLVLIDPKRIELSLYRQLKQHHLLRCAGLDEDVITNTDNAKRVLRGLEREMDERYQILQRARVKDIKEYNIKVEQGRFEELDMTKRLPYILVVVDELADLMMTGGKEVEDPIARLAALSRAVGIHLVLATQRPSVDVVTGVIKANFPARIAFKVTQRNDSRTILDKNGADKLLGNGDMLYLPPGQAPIRLQGAFLTTDEITDIVAHIHRQPRFEKPFLALPDVSSGSDSSGGGGGGADDKDQLFHEALKLVIRHQQGSASLLQRRLKVGYARASRLIDQLEMEGIVGPSEGSKARQVMYDETYLESLENSL